MLLPDEHGTEERITTTAELKNLLSCTRPIKSLCIEGAAIEYRMMADVISLHNKSIERLTFYGQGRTGQPQTENANNLITAIEQCSHLQSCTIEHFGNNHLLDRSIALLCCRNLTQLSHLSLEGTHIALLDLTLLPDLSLRSSLKKLNLTGTFYYGHWESFSNELAGNSSIEELILGNTPINLRIVKCISKLVSHKNSVIKKLIWHPPKFETDNSSHPLTDNKKIAQSNVDDVLNLRAKNHHIACQQLDLLQNLIDERNKRRLKMELVFDISNENYLDLNYISGQVSLHSMVLQHLTIRINMEKACPALTHIEIENFVTSLKMCQRLRALRIENFQGTFHRYYWHQLMAAIAGLPQLQKLSFRKTYIGQVGMSLISDVLSNNQLETLDLTLCGMISFDDAEHLAHGITSNRSLKEVILDKTPLTLEWLGLLQNAAAQSKAKPNLTWQFTPKAEMQTKMRLMCSELVQAGYTSNTNDAIYYLGIFCKQTEQIDIQWQNQNEVAKLSGATPANNERAITQNTRLLGTTQANYGACADLKISVFKPR